MRTRTFQKVRYITTSSHIEIHYSSSLLYLHTFDQAHIITMSIETELQDPLIEEVGSPIAKSGSEKNTKTSSKKRKRGGIQDQEVPKQKVNEPGKRRKHAPFDEEDVDVEAGLNNSISKMNDHLLVDYVARQTRRYESDLSSVELEDRYLPGK